MDDGPAAEQECGRGRFGGSGFGVSVPSTGCALGLLEHTPGNRRFGQAPEGGLSQSSDAVSGHLLFLDLDF